MSEYNVKKAYVELVNFLEDNKGSKVNTILPEVIKMCQAKSAGGIATASHRDENGEVDAIRCAYFGLWFPTSHVDFGRKEGSATGFNSMCKEGANNFSRKQREHRLAKEKLLNNVQHGEIAPEDIGAELEKLEEQRKETIPFSVPGMGWENLEDCLAQSEGDLDALVAAAQPEEDDVAEENAD